MAAVSHTATALRRPSSSHGTGYSWEVSVPGQTEKPLPHDNNKTLANDENAYPSSRPPLTSQNGHSAFYSNTGSLDSISRKYNNGEASSDMKPMNGDPSYVLQPQHKDLRPRGPRDNESPADSLLDLYGAVKGDRREDSRKRGEDDLYPGEGADDNSKWIHRDKLAKIENEELQAAGIFLPMPRERSRSKSQNRAGRHDQSQDRVNGQGRGSGAVEQSTRSRKNSITSGEPRTPDVASVHAWDLRLPEEAADEAYFISNGGVKGLSRIPVAKASPVPIPSEHLERDTLLIRKRDSNSPDDDALTFPKTRARSGSTGNSLAKTTSNGTGPYLSAQQPRKTDASPKKAGIATGTRRPSAVRPNGVVGRPKTRGGPSKDSTSSGGGTTRPSTRSGERELSISSSSKQMEGEPPWMVSAYRPDPRLPPDQQLLPTVARRLQQEKWEREGKFGNVYDREFRPLTDEGFLKPPELDAPMEKEAEKDEQAYDQMDDHDQGDWPLKTESSKSPTLPGRVGSYSTMPKISDKPGLSPLPSPRVPTQPQQLPQPTPAPAVQRIPQPLDEEQPQKKDGCGCCVVM
ncbi:hypothetical protein B0H63DRAFT_307376 [Podospora didyma]|uniref:TeaA receptor TeaR n=1 Tax=Podospora didyma TaxID=330526 RepID=A0AAE0K562_9PEZI|nr:hypothetical protein B0H63DRAFT_307376 [Podospora didyma]